MNKSNKKRPKKYEIDEKKLDDIIKELEAEDLNDLKTVVDILKELEQDDEYFTLDKDAERALLKIAYDLLDETVKGINIIASRAKTKSKSIKGVDALLFLAHQCELAPKLFAQQYHGDIELFMEFLKTKKPLTQLKKEKKEKKAAKRQPVNQLAPKTNTKSLSEQSADEKLVNLILNGTRLDTHILQQSKNVRLPYGIDRNYLGEFSGYATKKTSVPEPMPYFSNAATTNQPVIEPLEVTQTPYLPGYIQSGAEILLTNLKPFYPGTETMQDGTNPFRASASTFQSGTGLFQPNLQSYHIQPSKDQLLEFQLAQETQKEVERNVAEGEEFDQDVEHIQSDQLRQKKQLPEVLQLSPEMVQYLNTVVWRHSKNNVEFESDDEKSDQEQLEYDEQQQDELSQREIKAWDFEKKVKDINQKENISYDSGDNHSQAASYDFDRESCPYMQSIQKDIQSLFTNMESHELDTQLSEPNILPCTMHSINSQVDLEDVPQNSELSGMLTDLNNLEHYLNVEQVLVKPRKKEPEFVDLTQDSAESREATESEEGDEQSDTVMEYQNYIVIQEQNNAVIEEQNNVVIEEENNAVIEENNAFIERQNNAFIEGQYNIVIEEQNNAVIEQNNVALTQNNAVENFFTKENSLEEIEFVSQAVEETQMLDKNLYENLYEKEENEIEVITIESSPEREMLIENEMLLKNNEETLQNRENSELIKIPPQNPSEPKPIMVSIDQDYLTSLDTPYLTKSSGKIPSKRSAGRPPLRKRASRKPYNRNQKKSNKIIIDKSICEINIDESSKRPPIKLSIKGIHGNSPCTVEINEPLQKKTFDNKLVQNSDTFKSLQKFDERSKIDEFSMPSTSGISSNKVSSEYNFDFTSDSELSEKEPIGRKLHKKRKKISRQTSDEEPWMNEPKKRKINSNMLTPKQKLNEKSSHKAEKFSSKMTSKSSDNATRHKHHSPNECYQKSTKNKSLKSPSKDHGRKLSSQSLEPKNKKHSSSQQASLPSSGVLPANPSSHITWTDSSLPESSLATSSNAAVDLSIPSYYREYYEKKGIIFKGINFDFFGL